MEFDREKIGAELRRWMDIMKMVKKEVDPVIIKFGVYNVINRLNGHESTSPVMEEAIVPLIEKYGEEFLRLQANYIRERQLI